MPTIALLSLVVGLGATISTAVGFGSTLITLALGSLLMPTTSVLFRFLPLSIALSTFVVVRHARAVHLTDLFRQILPVMVLGMPVGIYATSALPPQDLERAFAAFVFLLAATQLLTMARTGGDDALARPLGAAARTALLFLGGVAHGALATGGPPVVYVTARAGRDKRVFRATLCALWILLDGTLLVMYVARGRVTAETLHDSLWLAPGLACGIVLGERLHAHVSERAFRVAVFAGLLVVAVLLGVRA